jgi:polyferredoxin
MILNKNMIWLSIFIISLALSKVYGRFYCGYICPMNTTFSLSNYIKRKLKIKEIKNVKAFENKLSFIFFLGITVLISLILKKTFNISIPMLVLMMLLSFLFTIFYKESIFHNNLCPFGFLLRIVSKRPYNGIIVNENNCVGCSKCVKSCPSESIKMVNKKAKVELSTCLVCGTCSTVCKFEAIDYKRVTLDTDKSR